MKVVVGTIAVCCLVGTSALAADMPVKAPYAAPAGYSWTGCYLGINGAGARADNTWQPFGDAVFGTVGPNGVFGGGQIGCDYQAGPLVAGVEGSFDWGNANQNVLGVAAGAGFEVAFLGNASFKVEYNYIYPGSGGLLLNCINPSCIGQGGITLGIKENIQTVQFGLNYRFGLGSAN